MVDFESLLAELGGDQGILEEVMAAFREDAPRRVEAIARAMATGDHGLVREEAHALKGAAGSLRAGRLRQTALELELAARDSAPHPELAQKLEKDFRAVMAVIQERQGGK